MFKRLSSLLFLAVAACTPVGSGNLSGPECSTAQPQPTKAETSAWNRAKRINTADSYRAFLRSYPKSCYSARAAGLISARLKAAKYSVTEIGRNKSKDKDTKAY
jgi:hypothetical protein